MNTLRGEKSVEDGKRGGTKKWAKDAPLRTQRLARLKEVLHDLPELGERGAARTVAREELGSRHGKKLEPAAVKALAGRIRASYRRSK